MLSKVVWVSTTSRRLPVCASRFRPDPDPVRDANAWTLHASAKQTQSEDLHVGAWPSPRGHRRRRRRLALTRVLNGGRPRHLPGRPDCRQPLFLIRQSLMKQQLLFAPSTRLPSLSVPATSVLERLSDVRSQPSASLTLSWPHCNRTARSRRRSCSRSKDRFRLTSRSRRAISFRIAMYWSAPWLLLLMRATQPFEARDVRRNTLVVTTNRQPVGGGRRRGPRVAPASSAIDVPLTSDDCETVMRNKLPYLAPNWAARPLSSSLCIISSIDGGAPPACILSAKPLIAGF
jgi:hypothetical protein